MKKIIVLVCHFIAILVLFSCGSDNSSKEKELELKEKELELRERELNLNKDESIKDDYENESKSKGNSYSQTPKSKSADDLRQELYQKEKKKPKDYLSVTYDLNYRVLSGKDEIIGNIYNYATMATFKDVVLTVTYSTNTDTELYRENFVVYDYVYPGSSTSFNLKTYSPEGTKKIAVSIKSATGE